MKPAKYFNPRNFRVQSMSPEIIKPIIEQNHYLHRLCVGVVRSCFGIIKIDESRLVGALVFGEPVRRNLSTSISPVVKDNEVIELLRVWIEDGHGSNIESWSIAQAFKMLPPERKVIVSYADPFAGHTGKIYQALNGIYQELPEGNSFEISLDGVTWLHERTQGRRFGKHSIERLKKKLCQNFYRKRESRKYRYLWILKDEEKILQTLKHPISPYPKEAKEPPQIEEIIVATE